MMTQKEMLSRPDAGYYYRIDWGEIRCERSLCLFKTSLSFPKKHLYTSLITPYLIYSAYICELSTVRAIYQQNKHCFD